MGSKLSCIIYIHTRCCLCESGPASYWGQGSKLTSMAVTGPPTTHSARIQCDIDTATTANPDPPTFPNTPLCTLQVRELCLIVVPKPFKRKSFVNVYQTSKETENEKKEGKCSFGSVYYLFIHLESIFFPVAATKIRPSPPPQSGPHRVSVRGPQQGRLRPAVHVLKKRRP